MSVGEDTGGGWHKPSLSSLHPNKFSISARHHQHIFNDSSNWLKIIFTAAMISLQSHVTSVNMNITKVSIYFMLELKSTPLWKTQRCSLQFNTPIKNKVIYYDMMIYCWKGPVICIQVLRVHFWIHSTLICCKSFFSHSILHSSNNSFLAAREKSCGRSTEILNHFSLGDIGRSNISIH